MMFGAKFPLQLFERVFEGLLKSLPFVFALPHLNLLPDNLNLPFLVLLVLKQFLLFVPHHESFPHPHFVHHLSNFFLLP